ncbi:MAG: GxxExxY protein [Thermoplasmatota archaeon]
MSSSPTGPRRMRMSFTGAELDRITGEVVDAAYAVHSRLGAGLYERIYQLALARELRKRGFQVELEVAIPIVDEGEPLGIGVRLDMLVEQRVVVEVKSVETLHSVHMAQMLTYLRVSGKRVGLIANFGAERLRDGIHRIAVPPGEASSGSPSAPSDSSPTSVFSRGPPIEQSSSAPPR